MATEQQHGEHDPEYIPGRTRWNVFALVFAVGLLGVGLMFTGMSRGALATSFAVSGTSYKATADKLTAAGVVQYGSAETGAGNKRAYPVLVNGFREAKLTNFCQSFVVADLPMVGEATVRLEASDGMRAENLVLGVERVSGDLTLRNVQIGRDAASLDAGPNGATGPPGAFGIQADGATISDLRQRARSTTATTLHLDDVDITVEPGRDPCF